VPFLGVDAVSLAKFGDQAVPSLVRRVREPESAGEVGHIAGAMDVLEQMLEQPTIRSQLSPASLALIRQVAGERMKNLRRPETAWSTLGPAAYLSVATGDPQLRKQVEDLIGNDAEFVRRGIDVEKQRWFERVIAEALAKFAK